MRGPQIMLGYWKEPQATAAVLRDGWYFSGDIVRADADGFYYVLDRSKEMIKYKGFPVAPAEVESLLLEHPAVRDCGVVARLNQTSPPEKSPAPSSSSVKALRPQTRSPNNSATSSPTASPTISSPGRFTLWKSSRGHHRAKFSAENCAKFFLELNSLPKHARLLTSTLPAPRAIVLSTVSSTTAATPVSFNSWPHFN